MMGGIMRAYPLDRDGVFHDMFVCNINSVRNRSYTDEAEYCLLSQAWSETTPGLDEPGILARQGDFRSVNALPIASSKPPSLTQPDNS
jgi:hypothetical protein